MSKFSAIVQGSRARKTIVLPLAGAVPDLETGGWSGPTDQLDVRALDPFEEDEILANARKHATEKGVEDPVDGDPIYDRAKLVWTLVYACVDTASPPDAPQPYFDGFDQIVHSKILTRDHLAYLAEHQELVQDEAAPRAKDYTPNQFMAMVVLTAGGNKLPFVQLRPGARWSCFRTLAAAQLDLLTLKSRIGSESPDGTATTLSS